MEEKTKYKRKGEINFVLLGAKGTGKTVYLYHLNNRPEVSAISSSGTIAYLDSLKHDENGKIEATAATYKELYFYYKDKNYNIEFQIDDYDGNFVESWSNNSTNGDNKKKLTTYIQKSEGIFVVLPYEKENLENRFEKMKKEMQTFIDKIKEMYGEEYSDLPVPIVIVVAKWDESEYFKADDENQKALEYIENNPTLNAIKKDLQQYFSKVDILPISSTHNHNVIKPIEMVLSNTFNLYEKNIDDKKSNELELFKYLSDVVYDMRFYKNGIYKEMYDKLELKFAINQLSKIEKFTNIKQFKEYKKENQEIINALKDENIEKVQQIESTLNDLQKKKIFLYVFVFVLIIIMSFFGYKKYHFHKNENIFYNNIIKEHKAKNYSEALQDIVKYNKIYNKANEKHGASLKQVAENIKAIYRAEIDKQIDILPTITSLVKRYNIITDIDLKVRKYNIHSVKKDIINKQLKQITSEKKRYDKALNIVSSLSIDTLSKEDIDIVLSVINTIDGYDEAAILKDELYRKLASIMENMTLINQVNNEDSIRNLIDVASTMQLDNRIINMLNKRLAQIMLEEAINTFIEELNSKDSIESMAEYVKINWKIEYGTQTLFEINKIFNSKFSSIITEKLKFAPKIITSEDHYNRLVGILKDIDGYYSSLKSLPIDIKIVLDPEVFKEYKGDLELYNKYHNIIAKGIMTSGISLVASKNNSLGFNTSDDQIRMYIDSVYYSDSSGAFVTGDGKYTMHFSKNVTYYVGIHTVSITERNLIASDRHYTSKFNISINNIISLSNGESVNITLDDTYELTIK